MNNNPERPKNYWRDYAIIILLAIIPLPIALYFEIKYIIPLLPILIVTVLPQLWFRSYYLARARYKQLKASDSRPMIDKDSRVNENIARYIEAQQERKLRAKWWQFWL